MKTTTTSLFSFHAPSEAIARTAGGTRGAFTSARSSSSAMGASRKKPAVRAFPPSPLGRATARAGAFARVSSRADLKPPLSSDPVCRHSIGFSRSLNPRDPERLLPFSGGGVGQGQGESRVRHAGGWQVARQRQAAPAASRAQTQVARASHLREMYGGTPRELREPRRQRK